MRRNQDGFEPSHDSDRSPRNRDEDSDDDDIEIGVAHRPGRLPLREADEEEVAEDDIMEQFDEDDSAKAGGPDA